MKFKIAILGAGNVAWHLASALEDAGHTITEVYARSLKSAGHITDRVYAGEPKDDLDFSTSEADIFILAVKDSAIPEVADEVILPENSILVHTSGSVPLDILNYSSASYTGIFYPLQSFTKGRKIEFDEVPLLLESDDEETLQTLKKLAKSLSPLTYTVRSKDRKAMHIAAVFASNFSNHMIRIAEEVMRRQGLDFEMLKPLIIETISKSLQLGAKAAQTGPAYREDYETLEDHHRFLSYNESVAEIYRLISQDIIDG
ncbi:putative short-subunit dehydrogenase-like oxidoreductase (DUF2520 family) [Algoriphagus ratkowskyi]|uniref:DUF2520 domain-containing protein n=1 Tax=Algoriphagus ratkowskyi TaxID=57028 RepID=A0A2W7TAB8_9BACT|nr:Rossmann-like and DUF2520 domain-containing protein [Algoriphagus ratkowskyi]PZX60112.1 putative short-subunit dehydrogenase-like oxidoreductase (DUF2520 family) [Algoriphagus ratkowskyi]TXD75658.1 DUF2520 domain-containing protein [Algoriphagus ratkowskyi]